MAKLRCAGKPMTLVVLAGGASRRMRRDKATLPVAGETLIERVVRAVGGLFDEVVVSVGPGGRIAGLPFAQVEDEAAGQGPLRGILTGLRAARHEASFVIACDMPDASPGAVRAVVRKAAAADVAVAETEDGFVEPLFGIYKKAALPAIEEMLAAGQASIIALYPKVRTVTVRFPAGTSLTNLNTPADYRSYLRRLK